MNNTEADGIIARAPRRGWAEAVCAASLLVLAACALHTVSLKSITTDEAFLIPAGYYHLAARDFRPVNEHPPFVKSLSAAPLLLMSPEAPSSEGVEMRYYSDSNNLYWNFWRANAARLDRLSFWARVPVVVLTMLLGALVFVYARKLFGARAAAFAVLLFAIEPTVLAHSRVVQTDIPASLGFLLFCFAFYEHLNAPTLRRALLVGAAAGFAVVTKFSMVVVAPVLVVTALALVVVAPRRGQRRVAAAAQVVVIALSALLTIHAAYLFKQRPAEEVDLSVFESKLDPLVGERGLSVVRAVLTRVVPGDFIEGVNWQLAHAGEGHDAGLLGRYGSHGWWYYFPVAFALKTTIPFLLLSVASLAWGLWMYARGGERRWLVVLVPFCFYTALVMLSSINIGVRYYLPAYMFLFIIAGAFLDWLLRRARTSRLGPRAPALLIAVAFVWMGAEALRAHPDHMVYMNQLASARPHWWYLSDSNVEWGDDVRELAEYLKARGETEVRASLLNYLLLEHYGIGYQWAYVPPGTPAPASPRYVAIGASYLNGSVNPGLMIGGRVVSAEERVNLFDAYRRRTPEKIFGGSIYLYREE